MISGTPVTMVTMLSLLMMFHSSTAANAKLVQVEDLHAEIGSPDIKPNPDCLHTGIGYSGEQMEKISKKSVNLRLQNLRLPYNLQAENVSAHSCHFLCTKTAKCTAYTIYKDTCILYKTVKMQYRHEGSISGLIYCSAPTCSCRNVLMSGAHCPLDDGKRPAGQVPGRVYSPEDCQEHARKFNCSHWYLIHSRCTLLSSMDQQFMSLYRGAVSGSLTDCKENENFCQVLADKHRLRVESAVRNDKNHTAGSDVYLSNGPRAEIISRKMPDEDGRIVIDEKERNYVLWTPVHDTVSEATPMVHDNVTEAEKRTPESKVKEDEARESDPNKVLEPENKTVTTPLTGLNEDDFDEEQSKRSRGEIFYSMILLCTYLAAHIYTWIASRFTCLVKTAKSVHKKKMGWITNSNLILAITTFATMGSVQGNVSLTVYDTSGFYTGKPPTVKVIDAITVDSCDDISSQYGQPQSVKMEVLHRGSTVPLDVLECKIMVKTTSQYCESNIFVSKSYPRKTLTRRDLVWISRQDCEKARRTKQVEIPVLSSLIRVTDLDDTEQRGEIFLYGRQTSNGGCEGEDIVVGERLLKSSIIVAQYEIRIRLQKAKYSPSNRVLTLSDHTKLDGSRDFISVQDRGHFFYNKSNIPANSCERMASLFTGSALIHPGQQDRQSIAVVHSTSGDREVAFVMDAKVDICGRELYSTNIVNIFLLRLDPGVQKLRHRLSDKVQNSLERDEKGFLELSAIISTTYLQASLSTTQNFERVAQAFCLARRANLLGLLRDLNMDINRNNYREGISYLRRGSMLYIFFGTAIDAQIRPTDECYQEIPVTVKTFNGTTDAFVTSNGKILVTNATAISCKSNDRVPAGHFIRDGRLLQNSTVELSELFEPSNFAQRHKNVTGRWICLGRQMIVPCHEPQRLDPASRKWFNFVPPNTTRTAGSSLFGKEDMKTLYDTQTVDVIKASWYNNLVLAHLGKVALRRGQHIISSLGKIQVAELTRHLNPFGWQIFGDWLEAVNIIIATSFLIAACYNIVCGLIRLKAGLRVYGCSFKIFLAFFGSVWSSFLPFLAENKPATERLNVVEELQSQHLRRGQNMKRQLEVLLHILSVHLRSNGANMEEVNVGYIFTDPLTGQKTVKPVFPIQETPSAPTEARRNSVEYIEMDQRDPPPGSN